MIDVQLLRNNPQKVRDGIALKKFTCDLDAILAIDAQRRAKIAETERLQALQNQENQVMMSLDKQSVAFKEKLQDMKELALAVKALEAQTKDLEKQWETLLLSIPNIPHESVPVGQSDQDNQVIYTWGDPESVSTYAIPHFDIPHFQQWVDFPRGVKVTGAGFPFYVGSMAKLVRALIQFFLSEAEQNGYQELLSPLLVNEASATATGQLPDKESQMYMATSDELYFIPTAEVPVTNFMRDEILEESQLPIYRCGYTPCFRREAGSWGAHVRGLNRLHQFDKVELVKWVHPEKSFDELESLRQDAQRILQKLELPYRVLLMCTKDIGFAHSKQYDLEVWAGGQKRWLEVSSCSNFTDFQARRAGIRFRPQEGGKVQPVHTLNGSGLAVPRVLAALLENNLEADGRVSIPAVLQPWFGHTHLMPAVD